MRELPHSEESEKAVLGAVLWRESFLDQIPLRPDDFFFRKHSVVFQAMLDMREQGTPIDEVTLGQYLRGRKLWIAAGGPEIALFASSLSSMKLAPHFVQDVQKKAFLRTTATICEEVMDQIYTDGELPAENLQDKIISLLSSTSEQKSGTLTAKEAVTQAVSDIKKAYETQGVITGIPTGIDCLDNVLGGLKSGELIIVAARPSMGKTALALNMLTHAAEQGVPGAFFSLEMPGRDLAMRGIAAYSGIANDRLRKGLVGPSWDRVTNAAQQWSELPIFIHEIPARNVYDIRAVTRMLIAESGIKLVVVDYLQLMQGGKESREQQISHVSRNLKLLARECGVPVVALSQLNRKVEERTDKRPLMSDLRESGAIEQDADVILMLYRDEVYSPSQDNKGLAEIIVRKQRNGPLGTMRVEFSSEFTSFTNLR